MELFIRILPEDEKKYYPAECEDCGWIGSSQLLAGGAPIADTGDFNDPLCPVCFSAKVDETDNYQPLDKYIETVTKRAAQTIKWLMADIDSLRFSKPSHNG